MDTCDRRPVMAALDFSHDGSRAAVYAADLAARLGRPLTIVHVASVPRPVGPTIMSGPAVRRCLERARSGLREVADGLATTHPAVAVTTRVVVGDPVDSLVSASRDAFALTIGARGLGGHPTLRWGSISNRVVARAACPVIVVRSIPASPARGPIIVVADTPAHGDAACLFATQASAGDAIYVVGVHPDPAEHGRISLGIGALPLDHVIIRMVSGGRNITADVRRAAADFEASLIVVARERHGWPYRFGHGSVVHDVVDMNECPVAVVGMAPDSSADTTPPVHAPAAPQVPTAA
jgi:nucleotide-binding universal stress UspA family protein